MTLLETRTVALLCTLAAGAALGIALVSEFWGGLEPCSLCLWERWPYRIVIIVGFVAALVPARFARLLLLLLVFVVLAGAALAVVHVGVEQHFWPSPLPECSMPNLGGGSIAARLAQMPLRPAKPCDEPTFLIPGLPLSMAAMNLLYALLFAGLLAVALWRGRRRAL